MGFRSRISDLVGNMRLFIKPSIKIAITTTVAALAIGFSGGPIALADNSNLTTVYYVYLNDTYVGIVSDKDAIKELITKKSKEIEKSYKNMDLQLGSQITYIPEQVFHSTANNEATLKNLEDATYMQAKSAAIVIDGESVVYLDNQDTAKQVVKKLELKYVTEDQLKGITESKKATTLPPLKEAIPYQTEVVNDSSLPKGENREKQQGINGLQSATYRMTVQNGQAVKKDVINKTILQNPTNHIVVKGTKVIPSRGDGNLSWPTVGGYISSKSGYRWGKMHKGIDIARPSSRTIKAADNGVVVSAGWDGGYGNKIVINHQNGYRTVYAHLSSINVGVGQTVAKGSAIGVMGATGDATGVHLHFEVYKNGVLTNPTGILRR